MSQYYKHVCTRYTNTFVKESNILRNQHLVKESNAQICDSLIDLSDFYRHTYIAKESDKKFMTFSQVIKISDDKILIL